MFITKVNLLFLPANFNNKDSRYETNYIFFFTLMLICRVLMAGLPSFPATSKAHRLAESGMPTYESGKLTPNIFSL